MIGGGASKSSNGPTRVRKPVEVEYATAASLKCAKDGNAFARCEECSGWENASETKKPAAKNKEKSTEPKAKRAKKAKKPNTPKRPPTSFFVFMD
uniref:High mobility group B protein 7-like n=1 Tax=Nicotiana sylvestris TaxID=4096 RepID=A0A1U7Y7P3_NICSY|nr:PREDICTED: high mobility group B protein 7-like [Nicotiana sylvestris]